MRRSIIKSVFRKEVIELLRNRRSLIVMFGVPLLLYPTLTIALASIMQTKQDQLSDHQLIVGLVNESSAPELVALLAGKDNNARSLNDDEPAAMTQLKGGAVDAVVIAPPDYEKRAIGGDANAKLEIRLDGSRSGMDSNRKRLDKILDRYQHWIIERRLDAVHAPASLADAPTRTITDIASGNQAFGLFLAEALPMLLLLTGMLGALYPALSATTNERELGTLETLLVTPATREELLTAKAGVVLISGLLTALLNMVSMSLVLWRVASEVKTGGVQYSLDPKALALSYLAAVPTLIFFTALVLMAGLMARNLREANAYATPLMVVPLASMFISLADPAPSAGLLVTPVANTTLIIRGVLTGHASVGAFALAFVSSVLYAGLVLSMAGRLFTNEQLVNPEWEPISLRGFGKRRSSAARRPRWPAVDEVLALFAISLLLNFYIQPAWTPHGLLPAVAGIEILLVAAPALAFAWLGRYPWRSVFSFRAPSMLTLTGAVLVGIGLIPLVDGISYLQQAWHILPPHNGDAEGFADLLKPALLSHPIFTPIAVGALAGICEELLYRGPIQSALLRRFSLPLALAFGGALFSGAHVDLSGFGVRLILGVILGWTVVRTGSIFPAMLMHAVFDGVSLAFDGYQMQHPNFGVSTSALIGLALAGLAVAAIGWALIRPQLSAIIRTEEN